MGFCAINLLLFWLNYTPLLAQFGSSDTTEALVTGLLNNTQFYEGDSVSVPFIVIPDQIDINDVAEFTAYLVQNNQFLNPIGSTLPFDTEARIVKGQIPFNSFFGNGFSMRISVGFNSTGQQLYGKKSPQIFSINRLLRVNTVNKTTFLTGDTLEITYNLAKLNDKIHKLTFDLSDEQGNFIMGVAGPGYSILSETNNLHQRRFRVALPRNLLASNRYKIRISAFTEEGQLLTHSLPWSDAISIKPNCNFLQVSGTTVRPTHNQANGRVFLSIDGAIQPFSVVWSDNNGTDMLNRDDLPSGYYTVTVTDVLGCSSVKKFTVASKIGYSVTVTPASETGMPDGVINVFPTGGIRPYSLRLNNQPFNTPTRFFNLFGNRNYRITIKDDTGQDTTFSVLVPVRFQINNLTTMDALEDASPTGEAKIFVSGGKKPYRFSVDNVNFRSDSVFKNLLPGDYTFYAKDANDSIVSRNFSIKTRLRATLIPINLSAPRSNDGKIVVTASGGTPPYRYSINNRPFQNDNVFTNLAVGRYTITVRDANGGLIQMQPVRLEVGLAVSIQVVGVSSLGQSDGIISITASGGQEPYVYSINGGTLQTTNQFRNLNAGTYRVLVMDNTGSSQTITVVVDVEFKVSATQVGTSTPTSRDGQIIVRVEGGTAPFRYQLNTARAQDGNTFSNLAAGSYRITVTDATNKTRIIAVNLTQRLGASISTTGVSNVGIPDGEVRVSPFGGLQPYRISLNGGRFTADTLFKDLSAGTITIRVLDANNSEFTRQITLGQRLSANIITSPISTVGASNGSIRVIGIGGQPSYSYSINGSPFRANGLFTNLTAGVYTVLVRDAVGQTFSKVVQITMPLTIVINQVVECNTLFSRDASINVTAQGGVPPYQFSLDSTTFFPTGIFTNLPRGDYNVFAKDEAGNVVKQPIKIGVRLNVNLLAIGATSPSASDGKLVLEGDGGTPPYLYAINDGSYSEASVYDNLTVGQYKIRVIDAVGRNIERLVLITQRLDAKLKITGVSRQGEQDGLLEVNLSGGVPPYFLRLNNGTEQTFTIFENLPEGDHILYVRDAVGNLLDIPFTIYQSLIYTTEITPPSAPNRTDGKIRILFNGGGFVVFSLNETVFNNNGLFENLGIGEYQLKIMDEMGNIYLKTLTIPGARCQLAVSIDAPRTILCPPTTPILYGNVQNNLAPVTYLWRPNAFLSDSTSDYITPIIRETQTFTLIVSEEGGCISSSSVTVFANKPLNVTSLPAHGTVCSVGEAVRLKVSSDASEYMWVPDISLNTSTGETVIAMPSQTTTYTVTALNGPCLGLTSTVTVRVSEGQHQFLVDKNAIRLCRGGSESVRATGAEVYRWLPETGVSNPNSSTVRLSPTQTTIYTVTGSVGNCEFNRTIRVFVDTISTLRATASLSSICVGQSTQLSVTGGTVYRWSPSVGLSDTIGSMVTARPNRTTVYTVQSGGTTTCPILTTVRVVVSDAPNITQTPVNPNICRGNSTTIALTGGVTYVWSPNTGLSTNSGGLVVASPQQTTDYTVTITNTNGCSIARVVRVNVSEPPTITANASIRAICAGSSTALTATGATNFSWSPSGSLNRSSGNIVIASPNISTAYTVTGFNTNSNCNSRVIIPVTVVNSNPLTVQTQAPVICQGQHTNLKADGFPNYLWQPVSGLNQNNGSEVVASPLQTTTYTVTGIESNCFATKTITITVNDAPIFSVNKSLPTASGNFQNGQIKINTSSNLQEVFVNNVSKGTSTNFSDLTSGIYTVKVVNVNGCESTQTVDLIASNMSCVAPTNLVVTHLTAHNAAVRWFPSNEANSYTYTLTTDGHQVHAGTSTLSSLNFTGLVPNTTYLLTLRANCTNQLTSSPVTVDFTTLPATSCPLDLNFINLRVTPSSLDAVISWNPLPTGQRAVVVFRKSDGIFVTRFAALGATNMTISNLSPGTTYEYRFGVSCNATTVPTLSDVFRFQTLNPKQTNKDDKLNTIALYPNPCQDYLHILLDDNVNQNEVLRVSVTDISGRVLLEKKFEPNALNLTLNVEILTPGAYFLNINNRTYKFLKQ